MCWPPRSIILDITCFYPEQIMANQQVLLVCSKFLFGEGLENLLQKEADLDIIGPWDLEDDLISHLDTLPLDVVAVCLRAGRSAD